MLHDATRFNEIVNLGKELNSIQDFDILLEKILASSRNFVDADAGSIYVREGNELVFSHVQNQTLQDKLPSGKKLIYSVFRIPINNKSIAGYAANTGKTVNIADVYKLPKSLPYSFNELYDKISKYVTKSMLTVPLKTTTGEVTGVLQIINAKDKDGNVIPFAEEDEPFIVHFANTGSMVLQRAMMTRTLLIRMIRMAEFRDPKETSSHINRVGAYSVQLYERWAVANDIEPEEIEKKRDILRMAAMLHDVGKVAISDLILKKPAKLDKDEYEIMKTHAYLGASLFKNNQSEFDELAAIVALNHHENWDGTGYPGHIDLETGECTKKDKDGNPMPKKGRDIPIYGRIVAIADVYDALVTKRAYKEAWTEGAALEEIKNLSGVKFDPELVEIFFDSLDEIRSITERYSEEE